MTAREERNSFTPIHKKTGGFISGLIYIDFSTSLRCGRNETPIEAGHLQGFKKPCRFIFYYTYEVLKTL
jgi:hypothetical protein